jgi:hypothetical protein
MSAKQVLMSVVAVLAIALGNAPQAEEADVAADVTQAKAHEAASEAEAKKAAAEEAMAEAKQAESEKSLEAAAFSESEEQSDVDEAIAEPRGSVTESQK